MKLAVFGATGGTGQQVVEQALAAGHQVTVLVRDPAKLGLNQAALTVRRGNVLEPEDVFNTVSGADAVIVSLGSTSNNPDSVVSQGTANVVDAMQKAGVAITRPDVAPFRDKMGPAYDVLRRSLGDETWNAWTRLVTAARA